MADRVSHRHSLIRASCIVGWWFFVLCAGLIVGLASIWVGEHTGVLETIEVDPKIVAKWAPPPPEIMRPVEFFSAPKVVSGRYFRRRSRDIHVDTNVLAREAERNGFFDHPYHILPSISVRYGRYGFREEFPVQSASVALLGASYAEAGYLGAAETWEGQLRERFGLSAANFGVAHSGGFAILHFLDAFVLPTKPKRVVWIFAERFDFSILGLEEDRLRGISDRPTLPSLLAYVHENAAGFITNGVLNGKAKLRENGIRLGTYDPLWDLPQPRPLGLTTVTVNGHDFGYHPEMIPQKPFLDRGAALLDSVIGRLAARCRAADVPFSILFLPSKLTLFAPYRPDRTPVSREYRDALWAAADHHGVQIADTTLALQHGLERGEMVVNPVYDQHLSAAGVRISTEVMARELIEVNSSHARSGPQESGDKFSD